MKKYRENMQIKNIDDVIVFLRNFIDNISYDAMREIAKDKSKLDLVEKLFKEFGNLLNDIDYLSKAGAGKRGSKA